jgi:hypothetical protein
MDFFNKFYDVFTSIPFVFRITAGIFLIPFFAPLGICIIVFSVILRKRDGYGRKNIGRNAYEDSYPYVRKERPKKDMNKVYDEINSEFKSKIKSIKSKNKHLNDLKSAEKILNNIRENFKKGKMKDELKNIYSKMQSEFENAKRISKKIDEINNILNDPDWDLNRIQVNINNEKNSINQDPKRLERMYEMQVQIRQLHERKTRLCNQISDLNIGFQTIYTKLTLLDIQEKNNFDEIETDIQRILDFKLKVEQNEDRLDKEMKEFL